MDDSKQQAMMRQIATQVYNELGTKFGVAQVPTHTHNGIDSVTIPYKNLIQGEKYTTVLSEDTSETVTLGGIFNPTRIVFQGFAANNADGTPATKRAIINGEINFGVCFEVSDPTPPIVVTTSGSGKPFTQSSNSMYVDSTTLANNRVSTTAGVNNYTLTASGAFVGGETSATLTSNWTGLTMSKVFVFSNGDTRVGSLTNGSPSISWTGALSAAATVTITATAAFFIYSLDNGGIVFASARLISFDNQLGILTVQFAVGTNVKIQGAFTIT